MIRILSVCTLLLAMPTLAAAQEYQVTRRSYSFMHDRLTVKVDAQAAGELHIIRGERGRVEVAARSDDGFPGFGLSGSPYRELRLTAAGAERVQYLVVVPERVSVNVQLPGDRGSRSVSREGGVFHWGDPADEDAAEAPPVLPTTSGGLYVALNRTWAPSAVDIADLGHVRSLSVRVEGGTFRVAASRPLSVAEGSRRRLDLQIAGDPVDVVLYIPAGTSGFDVTSGGRRLITVSGGRPRSSCSGVVVQAPTAHQVWLTLHPRDGVVECR